jgi:hypothetical protein
MAIAPTPKRGEIWLVDFDPAVGAEIRKIRPAVVINVDNIGRLPLRMVVPVTDWKPLYASFPFSIEGVHPLPFRCGWCACRRVCHCRILKGPKPKLILPREGWNVRRLSQGIASLSDPLPLALSPMRVYW